MHKIYGNEFDTDKLIVERFPEYLSPSSISAAMTEPNTFFCQKLIFDRMPREPQNLAMGVGTAFDILVKERLILKGVPTWNPIEIIRESLEKGKFFDESYVGANLLMKMYSNSRLIGSTRWVQVEGDFHQEYTFEYNGKPYTVPLMCKLDAVVHDDEYDMDVPLDWKCSGYASLAGATPKPGYYDRWGGAGWEGPHKNYTKNMLVTELGSDWARQFTMYGMALNKKNGIADFTEFPVYVHHPVFNGKNKKPQVAVYRSIVTSDFQREVWGEIVRLWEDIGEQKFLNRLTNRYWHPWVISVLSSYANECESFFGGPRKSAQQLWIESK